VSKFREVGNLLEKILDFVPKYEKNS
jgi:hypothetical protein